MQKFVGLATVSTLVLSLLVPSLSFGREFSTDHSLSVYPENEVLNFGSINLGDTDTKDFVIENSGLTDKVISLVTLPSGDFSYAGAPQFTVPAQTEVSLPIHFEPSAIGLIESQFTIEAANTHERKILTLVGEATNGVNHGLELSTNKIIFPVTPLHSITDASVVVKNKNTHSVSYEASITGDNNFRLRSDISIVLNPNEEALIKLQFVPRDRETHNATLELRNRATDEVISLPIEGPGLDNGIDEERILAFAEFDTQSTLIGLGTVNVHEQRMETFNVANTGGDVLRVSVKNQPRGPFKVDLGGFDKEETEIGPGEEGQIRVTFMPDFQGVYTSTFELETNADNARNVVFSVSGTAENAGANKFDFTVDGYINDDSIYNNESTTVRYRTNVPAKTEVRLKAHGETVRVLKNKDSKFQAADTYHNLRFNADDITPGIYTVEVKSFSNDGQIDSTNLVLDIRPVRKHTHSRIKRNPADQFFNTPNPVINIDNGEKAYFNFYAPTLSNITYTIKNQATGRVVVQRAFGRVSAGTHNYEFSWDGKAYNGNKVSEGEYLFEFKIDPTFALSEVRVYEGSLIVERNDNHVGIQYVTTKVGSYFEPAVPRVISSYYSQNRNTELRNNENLISELVAGPTPVTEFNEKVIVSFNTLHYGVVTASVKDNQGNIVRRLTSNRRVVDGYHHNELEWSGDATGGAAALDGTYSIEIHTAQGNETDTDRVYVTLARGYGQTPVMKVVDNNAYLPIAPKHAPVTPINTVQPYAPSYAGSCEGFDDVYGTDQFCSAVSFVVDQGIFEGSIVNGHKVLRPDDYLTRAEATAVILRVMRLPILQHIEGVDGNYGFSDVDVEAWYMPHIKTIIKSATQQQTKYGTWVRNIMQGYPDGTFRPNQVMSRAEFYKVFLEAAQNSAAVNANFSLDYHVTEAPFSDTAVNELTEWYLPYADWATKYLNNTDFAKQYFDSYNLNEGVRRFKAKKGITRGEVIDLIFTTQATGVIHY